VNTDINITDILIHLHLETTEECKGRIDEGLRALDGVVSVHFSEEGHPHAPIVAYNPEAVSSDTLLAEVRKSDSDAVMAGF
jgi:hypothetical protein